LTDKQYEWAVLPPRANLHKWADIQELLTYTVHYIICFDFHLHFHCLKWSHST